MRVGTSINVNASPDPHPNPSPDGRGAQAVEAIENMSNIKTFHLPDLGEGLPDGTIVEWFVKEGDVVKLDGPLVSMETAKAVVEVPSPYSGKS